MTYHPDPRLRAPHNPAPHGPPGVVGPPNGFGPPTSFGRPYPAPVAHQNPYPAAYPFPYRPPTARKSRVGLWVGLAIVAGVVVFGLMAMVFVGRGTIDVSSKISNDAQQILDDNLDIERNGDGTIETTNYGLGKGKLPVTLTNKGEQTASFTVTFDVISDTDMVIADDATASATDLGPGQSVSTSLTFSSIIKPDKIRLEITDVSMS